MKTINILGDTQREQWHGVVNMLRQLGGILTREVRSNLCDELDRYIDAMEDANENSEQETVYALVHKSYVETELFMDIKLFSDIERARDELRLQYEETLKMWKFDTEQQDEFHNCAGSVDYARINDYTDFADWKIEEKEVSA